MRVQFCGVRGSLPAPGAEYARYGGHTSCLAVFHDGAPAPALLLDAGTGLVPAAALFAGAPFAGTILLSHLHWDHVYGLPFFAAGDRPEARVRVMVPAQRPVAGTSERVSADDDEATPSGAPSEDAEHASDEAALAALAGLMSPPYFPIGPTELRGDWTFASISPGEHRLEGFAVSAREIPHKGGRTLGYRIDDGHSTLAYLPDHNPTALGPGEDGVGVYHPAALELARDADVLVHDSQLFPPELPAEGYFGHAVGDYAVRLGARAGTRAVVLFHHKHTRTDEQLDALARRLDAGESAGGCRGAGAAGGHASPTVSVAAEGDVLKLRGD